MKIYVSTDIEGATGVFKFQQSRAFDRDVFEFREAMKLLMGDIAAVCAGLKEAGADEILVIDGHNGGDNFIPKYMVSGVKYYTGRPKPILLDASFDGGILLGFHAMNGTPDGVLNHTQSSSVEAKYFYDGVERGEIYQAAVKLGHFDIPVILVTGDEATCREAMETLGDHVTTVAVKKGIAREAAVLLAPEDSRRLLFEGAKRAMANMGKCSPYKVNFPIELVRRSISSGNQTPENPYFIETRRKIQNGLDILHGMARE